MGKKAHKKKVGVDKAPRAAADVAGRGKPVSWFADEHYKLKLKKEELQQRVKLINDKLDEIEERALKRFKKEQLEGAKGKLALAFIQEERHPQLKDRAALDRYVKKTGRLELYQNRISAEAYWELVEQGEAPPGIEVFRRFRFRTRKAK